MPTWVFKRWLALLYNHPIFSALNLYFIVVVFSVSHSLGILLNLPACLLPQFHTIYLGKV